MFPARPVAVVPPLTMSNPMIKSQIKEVKQIGPGFAEQRRERRFHALADLMFESVRRQTLTNWTVPFIDPDQLAQAGFFYLRSADHVQCAFCQGIVGFWDPGDIPVEEHRRHFGSCRFLKDTPTANVPSHHTPDDTGRMYRLLEEYHQFRISNTKPTQNRRKNDASKLESGQLAYPQFNTEAARLQTFLKWPRSVGLTPEVMAAAGFFYTGLSDFVQCFHCGGGLFAWREEDVPTADHAHYYPWCSFIRTIGDSLISARLWGDNLAPSATIRPIQLSSEEEDLLLAHPIAKRVVEMGLSPISVKKALKDKLERTGRFCLEVTETMELVFDYDERMNRAEYTLSPSLEEKEAKQSTTEPIIEESTSEDILIDPAVTAETKEDQLREKEEELKEEVRDLESRLEEEETRLMCRICKNKRVEVVLQPCSHLHVCQNCARPLDTCPTCNTPIRGTLRPILG